MEILEAIVLGIVQGITEWLPVSSSGHLVIIQKLLGLSPPIIFDIMLHIGSLTVVVLFFWKDIIELVTGVINWEKEKLRIILMLVIATIPIAIVGYFFQSWIELVFHELSTVGYALLFTALLLFFSRYPLKKNKRLNYWKALIVGLFQAIAILPGVSRSGSTISSGMMLGIKREDIARFSFLMFIPAIIGALALHINEFSAAIDATMIVGAIVSATVGYFSLRILMRIIRNDKFYLFSIYCLVLGIIVLAFSFF